MATNLLDRTIRIGIIWAILLIVCGIVALALPLMTGIGVAIVLAGLVIVAGVIHLATILSARSFGAYVWRSLVSIAYLAGGIWLFMHPVLGLLSFTLVLGVIFLVEGIFHILSFFQIRKTSGSLWFLLDGIFTLVLALLILAHWPTSAAWAVATIVGVNLLISGVTRLMALLALRRTTIAA